MKSFYGLQHLGARHLGADIWAQDIWAETFGLKDIWAGNAL